MSSPKRLKRGAMDDSKEPGEEEWLKFEKSLGLGRQRGSSRSSSQQQQLSGNFDKICVVSFYCVEDNDDTDEDRIVYCLYCIDINSPPTDDPQLLQPTLCWNLDIRYETFVVLGPNLYMFGENRRFDPTLSQLYNCVSIYDIGSFLSSPPTTPPAYMDLRGSSPTGPRMKGCKTRPVAVVLGDSKICVFGLVLYLKEYFFPPSFEILDTNKLKWTTSLPELHIKFHKDCYIQSYCVRGSCLIIQIVEHGIYGINVHDDPSKSEWVKLDLSDNIRDFPMTGNWTMVGKTLSSPFFAKTRGGEGVQNISFKGPIAREALIPCKQQGLLLSDDLDLCIVRAGCDYFCPIPFMLVDIVKLDHEALGTLGSDSSEWKNIQSNKSFTFACTSALSSLPCRFVCLYGCFPIKVALEPAALSN